MKNCHLLPLSLFLVLSLFWTNISFANNEITQIRSNSLKDRLQIVLDLDEIPSFNAFALSSPVRLVVDVKAKPNQNYRNRLNFKHRGVTLVRTGMRSDDEIRVVLDLSKDFRWEVYSLTPSKRHSHRVVIDVYDKASQGTQSGNAIAKAQKKAHRQQNIPPELIKLTSIDSDAIKLESQIQATTSTYIAKDIKNTTVTTNKPKPITQSKPIASTPSTIKIKKQPKHLAIKSSTITSHDKPAIKTSNKKLVDWEKLDTTDKKLKQNQIVVVIDAGHGGKDSGAIGPQQTLEKNVVLQIAKRLAKKINKNHDMRAILTRKDDTYISLRGRLWLARKHKADLFVSIHADAFSKPTAKGSSVFILSNRGASSEAARWLAQRENAVDLKYGVDIGDYDKDIGNVLMQIQQDATIESSHILAKRTLSQLERIGKVHKNHVERAGFAVLKSPDIPSMLVETAFISNPAEEKKLRSPHYQEKLANAVALGIKQYFREHIPHHLMLIEAPK